MIKRMDEPFTRVSNEILEALSRTKLNGSEYAVILFVIRNTYGFDSKKRKLSLTYIANGTGVSRRHVERVIKKLIRMKILIEYKKGNSKEISELGLNSKTDKWCTECP